MDDEKQSVPIPDGYVLVRRDWYQTALEVMNGREGCPFCGSSDPPVEDKKLDTFMPRRGCGRCNRWWSPVRLRD